MKESAIITFIKKGKTFNIINIESKISMSNLTSMKQLVFKKNILNTFFKEDGTYKWIGTIEKKRIRYHAITKAFSKIS